MKNLNDCNKKNGGIMKLQESISITFSLIGVYFLLIFIGVLLYPMKLEIILGDETNLIFASLFLFLASYLISPYLWDKIFKR